MLVLIPPVGLDRGCWDWLKGRGTQAIRYEPPGFGARRGEPAPLSLTFLADELAAVLPGGCDVVGVSLGGMIAQHLALRHPGRVRSLLLAAATAEMDPDIALGRAATVERVGMAGVLSETLERWFSKEALANPTALPGIAYARDTLARCDPASFAAVWRAMAEHHLRDRLVEIAAPTTCVVGWADRSTPPEEVAMMSAGIPGARLVTVDGPHLLPLEVPEAFSGVLETHVASVARWSAA